MLYRSMRYIALILIVGFVAIGGFGLTMHQGHHGDGNCIAAFVNKDKCPETSLAMTLEHFGVYHMLSQAFSLYFNYFALILMLGLILFSLHFAKPPQPVNFCIKSLNWLRDGPVIPSRLALGIKRWLSLLENSPSHR